MDEDAYMAALFQLQQEEQQQLELAQRQLKEDEFYEKWLMNLEIYDETTSESRC